MTLLVWKEGDLVIDNEGVFGEAEVLTDHDFVEVEF